MTEAPPSFIFKITTAKLWVDAQIAGILPPSPIDVADGYMHFSTAAQTRETLALHFKGQRRLVLLRISTKGLGDALTWEPSRGGQLFPHLYAPLKLTHVDEHIIIDVDDAGNSDIQEGFL